MDHPLTPHHPWPCILVWVPEFSLSQKCLAELDQAVTGQSLV